MGLEISRVDCDRLPIRCPRHSHAFHHLEKDALVTPAFQAAIKRRGGIIFLLSIVPSETVAVNEDDAAQKAPIIDALTAMALKKNMVENEPFAPPSAE